MNNLFCPVYTRTYQLKYKHRKHQRGFSLIEISIVMIVAGLMMTSFLSLLQQANREKTNKEYDEKFEMISMGLTHYTFDEPGTEDPVRFPCPASLTQRQDHPNYGYEQCFLGDDERKNERILKRLKPGNNFNGIFVIESFGKEPFVSKKKSKVRGYSLGNKNKKERSFVLIGAVPAHTLQIPIQNMIDPYGNRIFYAVTMTLTEDGALLKRPPAPGAIKILTGNDAEITSEARFFVFSSGQDQAGSYVTSGRESGVECRLRASGDSRNCQWQYDDLAVFKTQDGFSLGANNHYFDDRTMARMFSEQDAAGWWQSLDEGGKNITMKNEGAMLIGDVNEENIGKEDRLVVEGNIRAKQIIVDSQEASDDDDDDDRDKWECEEQSKGLIRYKNDLLEFCDGDTWRKIITGGVGCPEQHAIRAINPKGNVKCIFIPPPP